VMSPEQLSDSINAAAGKIDKVQADPAPKKKGPALSNREAFARFFRIDEGTEPLEYQLGIPQALRMMNSAQLSGGSDAVRLAMEGSDNPAQVIDKLFLRTLSRRPTSAEVERFSAHVKIAVNARTGYGDVFWALLNSSEFTFNH